MAISYVSILGGSPIPGDYTEFELKIAPRIQFLKISKETRISLIIAVFACDNPVISTGGPPRVDGFVFWSNRDDSARLVVRESRKRDGAVGGHDTEKNMYEGEWRR